MSSNGSRMVPWHEKVALVTGASSGLGLAIARVFARAGANVVINGRDEQRLNAAVQQLRDLGKGDVLGVVADVTQQCEVETLVARTVSEYGRIDVLVNNAGRSSRRAILETTADDFAELLDANFLSVVHCTRAAAKHLIEAHGHLINIGSLASKQATRYLGAYPASKFAVAAYSQQLRLELGPEGLHVLLVCPGPLERTDGGTRYADEAQNLPEGAGQPGGGVRIKRIAPDWLAEQILDACRTRQAELVVPAKARWLFAIADLWPTWGDWIVRRKT